ncbi:cytochrome P450 [Lineolata rhizophorae]|uniref:Cytochrome P450 n=1 Tax=Lineolata rhizophorae TaxID=578093 RepID=A0A6A6P574_9PEZI|nr:cytochrome P450 [Lineolata rhizophorae]
MPLTATIVAVVAAFAVYIVGVVVYRLFFHPLARYPGPLLAKITGWHAAYHAWRGDRHLEFWRCHEKYGSIYRWAPNSISVNTNTALKDIYGHRANVRKADFYTAFPPTKDTFNTHSSIDRAAHARKRRVLSHAFSDSAIKTMEGHILDHVRALCTQLLGATQKTRSPQLLEEKQAESSSKRGWSAPQNMASWTNYLAFDVMGDLCFGKPFRMLTSPTNRFATDLVASASHRHLICGTYLPIHKYHLDKLLFRRIAAGRARYMAYSKAQAGERAKIGIDGAPDRRDFFYYLLQARDPETGAGFAPAELWGESNLLIIAGSDTTSTAMSATLFYLAHHPECFAQLARDVRAAFASLEDIRLGPALTTQAYLRACIDEAMRLSPSVGGLLPRTVLPGGLAVDGHFFPPGTDLGVPHYAVHHNEAYFAEPFVFEPSRWLPDEAAGGADAVARAQSAFCPFSIGPRGCIGKTMAYAEMSLTIARLVWAFDLRLARGEAGRIGEGGWGEAGREWGREKRGEYQLKDTFTSWKDGPMVEFKLREGAEIIE